MRIYRQHNRKVRPYFSDRPNDFLEVCWGEGDGRNELCKFVNHSLFDSPMSHRKRGRSKFLSILGAVTGWLKYNLLRS